MALFLALCLCSAVSAVQISVVRLPMVAVGFTGDLNGVFLLPHDMTPSGSFAADFLAQFGAAGNRLGNIHLYSLASATNPGSLASKESLPANLAAFVAFYDRFAGAGISSDTECPLDYLPVSSSSGMNFRNVCLATRAGERVVTYGPAGFVYSLTGPAPSASALGINDVGFANFPFGGAMTGFEGFPGFKGFGVSSPLRVASRTVAYGGSPSFGATVVNSSRNSSYHAPSYTNMNRNVYSNVVAPKYANLNTPKYENTYSPSYTDVKAPSYGNTIAPTYSSTSAPSYSSTMAPSYSQTNAPSYASTNAPSYASTNAPSFASASLPSYATTNAPAYASTSLPSYATTNAPAFLGAGASGLARRDAILANFGVGAQGAAPIVGSTQN